MRPENDHWFEDCFNAISHFIAVLDKDGRVILANRAAQDRMDQPLNEKSPLFLWDIPWQALTGQNRRVLKQAFSRVHQGAVIQKEIVLRREHAQAPIFAFSFRPLPSDSADSSSWILAEGSEITAYRLASEALFQSEARFRTIFEEAGMGIIIKGVNGKILESNPAFQNMLGYTNLELRHMDYLELTHPQDKLINRKLFNDLISGRRKNYSIEKRYMTKEGQEIWCRTTASLVHGPESDENFVIGMVENISLQKQIQEELTELQQRLMIAREQERLKFAQDLHDGPLQEVIGISFQVQEELETLARGDARREKLEEIRTNIAKLSASIRVICGDLRPPTLVPFGLEKTILSHASEFQKSHPELKVSHKLVHDGRKLPEHNRIVLFRIYQESLNNILRHSQAKSVMIRFRLTTKVAILEIQDDGVGFELPKQWVGLARQGHLGLVGAIERAREVGGDLVVTTAHGQGTLIRVTVPIK